MPNYTRNLFNVPVVAYSGELDKQIQAARVMEEAFAEHGETLAHIIGPEMGHKYDPASLEKIMRQMNDAIRPELEKASSASRVTLQTQTLRYNRLDWVQLLQLDEHWNDTRVDASANGDRVEISTQNVKALRLDHPPLSQDRSRWSIVIDGQPINETISNQGYVTLKKVEQKWRLMSDWKSWLHLRPGDPYLKRPRLQGPIDDAFLLPFSRGAPQRHFESPAGGAVGQFRVSTLSGSLAGPHARRGSGQTRRRRDRD